MNPNLRHAAPGVFLAAVAVGVGWTTYPRPHPPPAISGASISPCPASATLTDPDISPEPLASLNSTGRWYVRDWDLLKREQARPGSVINRCLADALILKRAQYTEDHAVNTCVAGWNDLWSRNAVFLACRSIATGDK